MRLLCSVLGAAALALLAFPQIASAHGVIAPAVAPPGETVRFVVTVPNDAVDVVIDGFALTPPSGVEIVDAEGADPAGETFLWTNADIGPGERGSFAFSARIPATSTSVSFVGSENYEGFGWTGEFPLEVAVDASAPGGAESGDASRTWIVVGTLTAGGGVLAAGFILLSRRRRDRAGRR